MSICINGGIDKENIKMDKGLLLGKGLFETILVKDKPVFLKEHLARLNRGLKTIGIDKNISQEYVEQKLYELGYKNCGVKLVVSDNNILISKRDITYKKEDYIQGFKVKISDIYRNPKSHFTYLKSINYLDNSIERDLALKDGYKEVIFLNYENKLTEGSVSNLFWISDGKIYTPSIECGLLSGIVRDWVINNFQVFEGKYELNDLLDAEGAFITNSLMGIMPISYVQDKLLNKSAIIERIIEAYENNISKY